MKRPLRAASCLSALPILACSSGDGGSAARLDAGGGGAGVSAGGAGDGSLPQAGSGGEAAGGGGGATGGAGGSADAGGPTPDASDAPPPDAALVGPVHVRVHVRNVSSAGTYTTSGGAPLPVVFSPGVFYVHGAVPPWFEAGAPASTGVELLAETGIVLDALTELELRREGLAGFFGADTVNVSYDDAPLEPGMSADFLVTASPGDHLELGMMWAQSNDVFVATRPGGIALFVGGAPRTGRVEAELALWDAGTEVNQAPGEGDTQAPRQLTPTDGQAEGGVIAEISGADTMGFTYPPLAGTLEVELVLEAPADGAAP